jgi:hypothetical protein
MLIYLLIFLFFIGLLVLGAYLPNQRLKPVLSLPEHRFAPVVVGVVASLVIWYVWGGFNAPPSIHDEAAYLLQARTFARFHWTMPTPPLPEFFEQYHVFVVPHFASKYPPGHAILLVPGIWLSLPGLMPLVLTGIGAGLLFMLVRRVTTGWVAVLTTVLWLPQRANLRFRSSYMSETTTSALWLLGWWALLEWRRTKSNRWLLVLAASIAWMGITRPVTAIAYALPIAAVVLVDLFRSREWRQLVRPVLVALAIVAIVPLWNARTLDDWRKLPYSEYSNVYFPYDMVGFGVNDAPPQRALSPDMQEFARVFKQQHREYTPDVLPSTFVDRWLAIAWDLLHGWRLSLVVFTLLGLAVMGVEGWFAIGTALLLTILYLSMAHPLDWTVYYLEIFPLVPFLTALGISAIAVALRAPSGRMMRPVASAWGPRQSLGIALIVLVLLWPASADTRYAHRWQKIAQVYQRSFRRLVATIPEPRAIVFVRYGQGHDPNHSLIANDPDVANARLWVVYDRGAQNAELAALAPTRATYLFDEKTFSLHREQYQLASRDPRSSRADRRGPE